MAIKNSAGKSKIVAVLILLLPAFLLVFLSMRGCDHKFKELPDYGKIADYSFTDANGIQYTSDSFKGKVVVISTLQKTCPDSCAVSLWHIDQAIYQHIRKNKKKLKQVKIISFVTDGAGLPVEDICSLNDAMKDRVDQYDPTIWMLAKGNARKVFDIQYNNHSLLEKGDQYFGGEAYLELMLLIDKQNHLRMVDRGKEEGTVRRLYQHIALLQKQYDKAVKKKPSQKRKR
jgi:hypothetical protein